MLPKIISAGFRETEVGGCPIIIVGGLECVSVWRVAEALGMDRLQAMRMIGERTERTGMPGSGQADALEPAEGEMSLFQKE
jgi:hypothetical protein